MTPDNLKDLYVHQLRDLYSAESQLIDALPKMEKKATNKELQQAFQKHLAQTRTHKERLEEIFGALNVSPSGETCKAMKGLVSEAEHFIKESKSLLGKDAPPEVLDAGLIAQAQRVEHYEISAYGTVATYAEQLGRDEDHRLLGETLDEEKSTDGLLNRLAKNMINPAAAEA